MDYEQKYKKALERAKEIHDEQRAQPFNVMTKVFPEIKDIEDERIRESLLEYLHTLPNHYAHSGVCAPEWIAWLEKQGEQESTDTDNKFLRMRETKPADIVEFLDRLTTVEQEFLWEHIEKVKKIDREEREQKSSWSEEDEKMLQGIWDEIIANKHDAKEYEWKTYDKFLDWLKSLKDRYTWKPSDEQMHALHDLNLTGNISYVGQGQELINLYNDLKKLKG